MSNNKEQPKTDLESLVGMIRNYIDYESTPTLTPDAIRNILDSEDFDHDEYELPAETTENKSTVICVTVPEDFMRMFTGENDG